MSLLKAASTVSLLTLASRITGLVRDLLMAATFGASGLTDAFNVAFRIPNLFRRLFINQGNACDRLLWRRRSGRRGSSNGSLCRRCVLCRRWMLCRRGCEIRGSSPI